MESINFDLNDIQQIKDHGLTEDIVKKQLHQFATGFPVLDIVTPAVIGNGILRLTEQEKKEFVESYDSADLEVIKFIPASGAASRMFRSLHEFEENFDPEKEDLQQYLADLGNKDLKNFFQNIEKLPFYKEATSRMERNGSGEKNSEAHFFHTFVRTLLKDLDFESKPKALIPFHQYTDKTVTAFEEHLQEAIAYAKKNGQIKLHFTVSEDHLDLFKTTFNKIKDRLPIEESAIEITYSFQQASTDTIAADEQNQAFRDKNNQMVFRPGGHGALIQNLNGLDTDFIFIKNIDNVVPEDQLAFIAENKKVLAGLLAKVQRRIFTLLEAIDENKAFESIKKEAVAIADKYFNHQASFSSSEEIKQYYNRPLRACGMVLNQGAPGGGPFWIRNEKGELRLQIVEDPQIDKSQSDIVKKATHFNPTDLVCAVRDYKGNKFDLTEFVDHNHGFITQKFLEGVPLKALELPGLWNGSMADWNTIFIEVPLETFNPVKNVMDLLNPAHQAK